MASLIPADTTNIPVAGLHHIISYNPLSMLQSGRSDDIFKVFKYAIIIALSGTRQRMMGGKPFQYIATHNRHRFLFGYGQRSNKHAGCEISICRNRYRQKDVVGIAWPTDPTLAGRAGVIRVRTKAQDLAILCVYCPLMVLLLCLHRDS